MHVDQHFGKVGRCASEGVHSFFKSERFEPRFNVLQVVFLGLWLVFEGLCRRLTHDRVKHSELFVPGRQQGLQVELHLALGLLLSLSLGLGEAGGSLLLSLGRGL